MSHDSLCCHMAVCDVTWKSCDDVVKYHVAVCYLLKVVIFLILLLTPLPADARVTILPTLVCHLEDFIQIQIPLLGYTSETTELCVQTVGRMLAILQFGEERLSREVIRHVLKLLKPILGLSFAMTRDLPAAVSAANMCAWPSICSLCRRTHAAVCHAFLL